MSQPTTRNKNSSSAEFVDATEPVDSSTMRFLRHGRANEWSRIWHPNPRKISSVIGVGDVPPRQSMLRRGIHEKAAERSRFQVIHLPCHALKTHVGSTTGSKFHPRMLHRSHKNSRPVCTRRPVAPWGDSLRMFRNLLRKDSQAGIGYTALIIFTIGGLSTTVRGKCRGLRALS
jgi:hypothetical protein